MPKRPTKPGIPIVAPIHDDSDFSGGKHRACIPARMALAGVAKLEEKLDDHADSDNDQLSALSRDVEEVRGEVKAVNNHVGNLRVDMARTLSFVENISDVLDEQNKIKHATMIAEVETTKVQKIAVIEDTADSKKTKRSIWSKIGIAVIGGVGYLLGMLIDYLRSE